MNENEVTIAGKTVAGISYPDSEEFSILFTDGTVLQVLERSQSGQIQVTYNGHLLADGRSSHD